MIAGIRNMKQKCGSNVGLILKKENYMSIWKFTDIKKVGRPPKYETPEELWEDVVKYFTYIDENPFLVESTMVGDKGTIDKTESKKRPYTWEGLYAFLSIESLDRYKGKADFVGILKHIGNAMYSQKFEGASSGLFNPMIIARDLHLKDRSDVTTDDKPMDKPVINIISNAPKFKSEEDDL
jgi:hypothetical protein